MSRCVGLGHRSPRSFRRLCSASFVVAAVIGIAALGGAASAASLQIGAKNKSKGQTKLTSSAKKKAALAISNTGGAAAASFTVKKNKTPFTVSSSAKVKNFNADLLDGVDSSQLQREISGACGVGSAIRVVNANGTVTCQPVLTSIPPNLQNRINGTCPPSSAIRIVNADGSVTCQPVLTSVPAAWNLTGNAGTDPTSDFLGTTDAQPLVIRTNNAEAMRVTAAGSVGIGTTAPGAKLQSNSTSQSAVLGTSSGANAVVGVSSGGIGELGNSDSRGVVGTLGGTSCPGTYGVGGCTDSNIGVFGQTNNGIAILGNTQAAARGIVGTLGGTSCAGIYAVGGCGANLGDGVLGNSTNGNGVDASGGNNGVSASGGSNGVFGSSSTGIGVRGDSTTRGLVGTLNLGSCPDKVGNGYGVGGCGGDGTGVEAVSNNDGVYAVSHHASGGNTAAAVRAINDGGGDVFIGQNNATNHVARIDSTGKGFFDGGTANSGADYAESIHAAAGSRLHPGDVLAIDPGHGYSVAKSGSPYSQLVVGVYSTRPAVLAVGSQKATASLTSGDVPVAMMGVVPTKVTTAGGAIRAGDLLTTSSVPGYAMRAKATKVHGIVIYPTGTIIGKALQPLRHGQGVIQVMLMSR